MAPGTPAGGSPARASRAACSAGVGREQHGADGERRRPADQPFQDAVGREAVAGRGVDGDEQDRRDPGLHDHHLAAPEQRSGEHRQHHHHAQLRHAGAERAEQQRRRGDADDDAERELQGALAAPAVGHADADHGGDRRERGARIGHQRGRQHPGRDGRDGGLHDRQHAPVQAPAARAEYGVGGWGHTYVIGRRSHDRSPRC